MLIRISLKKNGAPVFLKSVELFGFKSFADRSRIEFTDGISALLGPNGCGKSNVVDAIKWALGEQATKSLRADKMEDVIFNGTETRKPLNVAEVSLTLGNDEGLLPLDMPEIIVKRRLFRSGESEYYINNSQVLLKKVRELFYDTGIGKSAYSIMEQGKIDQVLSSKPEERRIIFEEAAAITKYRIKGQEAERKLAQTEENMRQVEGIIAEVKRSYDSLKAQCEKTLRYRKLREDSFELERDIQLLRLKSFLESKEEKTTALNEKILRRDAITREIDGINDLLEKSLDVVNSMESKLIENQKKIYGLEVEKKSLESQERMFGERLSEFEAAIASDKAREKSIKEKIEGIFREIGQKKKSLEDSGGRIVEIDKNIGEFEESLRTADARIKENHKNIAGLEDEIHHLEDEDEELRNDLRGLTDTIVEQLDQRLKDSGYSYHGKERIEAELDAFLEAIRIQLESKMKVLEDSLRIQEEAAREYGKILESLLESYRDLSGKVRLFGEKFGEYKKQSPAFIDEFLAPGGIITQKRKIDERIAGVRGKIRENRDTITALRAENSGLSQKIEEYRKTLEELRLNRERFRAQISGLEETLLRLEREKEIQEKELRETAADILRAKERIEEVTRGKMELQEKQRALEAAEKITQKDLEGLEAAISERNQEYLSKEKKLKAQTEELGKTQAAVEKLQIELTETTTEIRNMYDNFRERHSRELSEYENRLYEITSPVKDLRERLLELREEEKKLAPVNYGAPEEFAGVKERYDFLTSQLDDLKKAREDIEKVTVEIRGESAELFRSTFDKIRKNFHLIFRRLFGGGRAEITLSDPDPGKILESGIDIFAQPPGKSLESIALLSGGERALTAVALLFATYMVRPSPFCLLDEIDAALDESNVGRFVTMLMEFGAASQFIVITHNKKTATGAKTLLGVTMDESGVSKIVSIRLPEKKNDE
jgi:chromosome segregation protein